MDAFFSKSPERKNSSSDSPPPKIDFSAIAAAEQSQTSLPLDVSELIKICHKTIQDFELEKLIKKAENNTFKFLDSNEQEMLCAGMVQLGEALTFLRNPNHWAIKSALLSPYANTYVNLRNYFVHHHMYCEDKEKFEALEKILATLLPIQDLVKALTILKDTGIESITKEIKTGHNDFNFEFIHFVDCLKNEFMLLDNTMKSIANPAQVNTQVQAALDNRIRNILSIMLDLIDQSGNNTNKSNPCKALRASILDTNTKFCQENKEFEALFDQLKSSRNSLCHLDHVSEKPYSNVSEQLGFVVKLQRIRDCGYLNMLESAILSKQKEPSQKTAAESAKASTPVQPTKESSTKKPKLAPGLSSLLVYTANPEVEENKEPSGEEEVKGPLRSPVNRGAK